jgi:hypothetical protein
VAGEVLESEEELDKLDKEEEMDVEDSAVIVLNLVLSVHAGRPGPEEFCDEHHMYRC